MPWLDRVEQFEFLWAGWVVDIRICFAHEIFACSVRSWSDLLCQHNPHRAGPAYKTRLKATTPCRQFARGSRQGHELKVAQRVQRASTAAGVPSSSRLRKHWKSIKYTPQINGNPQYTNSRIYFLEAPLVITDIYKIKIQPFILKIYDLYMHGPFKKPTEGHCESVRLQLKRK